MCCCCATLGMPLSLPAQILRAITTLPGRGTGCYTGDLVRCTPRGSPPLFASPVRRPWQGTPHRPAPLTTAALVLGIAMCFLAPHRQAVGQAVDLPRSSVGVTVSGVVLDMETGEPVVGVHLELLGDASDVAGLRTVTVADGRFHFDGVVGGEVLIRARRVGYRPVTITDTIPSSDVAAPVHFLTLLLERAPAPLAGVIVTPGHYGVLDQKLGGAQTLSRDQITAAPQVGEDVFRLIGRLPGVAASDFSAAFRVRGGANEELLVTLDGLPLVEPYHLKDFDGALSIVDAGAVGGLELSAGGFGAAYGDRLTGLLDLRTREAEPGPPRTELALTLTALRGTSRGGFDDGRGNWLLSARLGFLDYALRLAGEDRDDFHPRYGDVFAKVSWRPNPEHRVALHFLSADDRLRFQSAIEEPLLVTAYDSRYLWATWQAQLDERVEARTMLSVGALGWNRQADRFSYMQSRPDLAIRDQRRYQVVTARQDFSWAPVDRMLFNWGAEVRRATADYDYLRMQRLIFVDTAHGSNALKTRQDTLRLVPELEGTTVALYLSQRSRPWSAVTTEVGIRLDRQSYTGERQISPRASIALSLDPRTTLRTAWGAYAQAQGLHELQVQDGEDSFAAAERAHQRVASVERYFGRSITGRLEAYDRRQSVVRPRWMGLDQILELLPEVGPDRRRIAPTSARARGVELFIQRDAGVVDPLTWSASYALASSHETVAERLVPRPLDQRHSASVDASYRFGDAWRVSAAWVYHSGWPSTEVNYEADTLAGRYIILNRVFGPRNAARQPAYKRMDLRVTHRFNVGQGRVTTFLDVFNVFNRQFVPVRARQPPFDALIGQDRFDQWLPRVPSFGITWEF